MAASLSSRWMMAMVATSMVVSVSATEVLPDPTRPTLLSGAADGGHESAAAFANAGLQSVIISPKRRAAVINGVTVELGGRIGTETLIEVRESSVLLRNAQGMRVLELFPGVSRNKPVPKIIGKELQRDTGKDERYSK